MLQDIADYNNMKRAVRKDIRDIKRKTRDSKQDQVKSKGEEKSQRL
jgi:hypothetical protein